MSILINYCEYFRFIGGPFYGLIISYGGFCNSSSLLYLVPTTDIRSSSTNRSNHIYLRIGNDFINEGITLGISKTRLLAREHTSVCNVAIFSRIPNRFRSCKSLDHANTHPSKISMHLCNFLVNSIILSLIFFDT